MKGTSDKAEFRGNPRGRHIKLFLRMLSELPITRVAVGADLVATIDTEQLRDGLRIHATTHEWSVMCIHEFANYIADKTSFSWLSLHLFNDEAELVENVVEDSRLLNEISYRQNFKALAELYVWDDGEVLLIAPTDTMLPKFVGSLRLKRRYTM